MKLPLLTAVLCLALTGCATDTGDIAKDRRGRVTNALLQKVGALAYNAALVSLGDIAMDKLNGDKVDFAHSLAEGLWKSSGSIVSFKTLDDVAKAYSGDELEGLSGTLAAAFRVAAPSTPEERKLVVNAIAEGVSEAAFDATGKP